MYRVACTAAVVVLLTCCSVAHRREVSAPPSAVAAAGADGGTVLATTATTTTTASAPDGGNYLVVAYGDVPNEPTAAEHAARNAASQARAAGYASAYAVDYSPLAVCPPPVQSDTPGVMVYSCGDFASSVWLVVLEGPLPGAPTDPDHVTSEDQARAWIAWHDTTLANKRQEAESRGLHMALEINYLYLGNR